MVAADVGEELIDLAQDGQLLRESRGKDKAHFLQISDGLEAFFLVTGFGLVQDKEVFVEILDNQFEVSLAPTDSL